LLHLVRGLEKTPPEAGIDCSPLIFKPSGIFFRIDSGSDLATLFVMKNYCLSLLFLLAGSLAGSSAAEFRTFHSSEGKPLKASLQTVSETTVTLKREDGKTFEIAKSKLSAADQAYIEEFSKTSGNEARALNEAAGHEISNGSSLTERKAEDLAKALKLPPESQSKFGRSWRLYAAYAKDFRLFGTMPYSVALYSDQDGGVSSISIVYANKGDFGSMAGKGEDHFKGGTSATAKTLAEAMTRDEETVSKALSSVLGVGKIQRFGEGDTRRKITRWDWNDHAFLLSNEENEYVSLAIITSETANNGGKSVRVKDGDVKQRLISSIVKSDNGDVHLSEIPMVDQGPKGYCAPATFERAMRTMGLEADMYLLAMTGQSKAGGGTSVETLLENVRSQVYRKGRRTKDDQLKELKIRDLKRYIDQGIPIMWTMCSTESYNEVANINTAKRKSVTDWKNYATEISTQNTEYLQKPKAQDKYHICLIIGYNESTQEIAVSDSWGARYELRWVPLGVASWASMGGIFMILP
jgi:hypothetical protein